MDVARVSEAQVPPPWSGAGHRRAHEWYTAMLAKGPVGVDEHSGIWQFFGYYAVREFLDDAETWSTAKRLEALPPESRVVRLLTSDPPQHVKLRDYFASAYRPKRIAQLEERVHQVCHQLLDSCVERGSFDLIADFAKPLTVVMIGEIIGIPPDKRELMMQASENNYLGKVDRSGADDLAAALWNTSRPADMVDVGAYFRELIDERRRDPQDDLVSALAQIPQEEMEDRLDVPALLAEQFGAGTNTTVHLIGSIISTLDQRRDLLAKLQQDRSLVTGAVEETVRFHSPLQARPRIATRDVEVEGIRVPEGTSALAWIGAANVDPARFKRPLEYDITRSRKLPHMGFGFGEHYCLGASLARMEARMAIDAWLDKVQDFERDETGPLAWVDDFILHGLEHFQVRVTPRA